MTSGQPRYWELDALRGSAVLGMLVYHLLWDVTYFGLVSFPLSGSLGKAAAAIIGGSFLLLLGLSATLDYYRVRTRGGVPLVHSLRRGIFVLGCGLGVSVITYFYSGSCNCWVRFGILHLAGVAIGIAPFFIKNATAISLFLAVDLFLLGLSWRSYYDDALWLLPFGITPLGFYSIDYYPIVPWLGVVLLGVVCGEYAYPNGLRAYPIPDWSRSRIIWALQILGRNSLMIYLVHQPLFLSILYGIKVIDFT